MSVAAGVKLAFLIAASMMIAACSSDTATPAPEGALMAVQSRGGMCMEGLCESTIYLERDGLIHEAAKPPNQLGMVPADALAELERQIAAADFDEIRSHPFTGTCPTAFDGQETVFEFSTADGVERIESCQVEVDYESPLFSAVVDAIGPFMRGGTDVPAGPEVPAPPPVPVP